MIADEAYAGILRLLAAQRAHTLAPTAVWDLRDECEAHGLLPLMATAALESPAADAMRPALSACVRDAAVRDAAQMAEARAVIEALAGANVPAIVLKGAHLACCCYARTYLRPRVDLDLLVSRESADRARDRIEAMGYTLVPHVRGDAILAQVQFTRTAGGLQQVVDVHWHALNPHAFRPLLPFAASWERSAPVPPLGASARGLCPPDALLHAVCHLAAHHGTDPRLIWVSDIDRLARRLTAAEWTDFVRNASDGRVRTVALAALTSAGEYFGTVVPADVEEGLVSAGAAEPLTSGYLIPQSRASALWLDLRAARGWRTRARLLSQHLWPDAAYMRERYGVRGVALGWAYLRRIASGAGRWLAPPG